MHNIKYNRSIFFVLSVPFKTFLDVTKWFVIKIVLNGN
jgi:hypothetical protein